METQEMSEQEKDSLDGKVMESLGESQDAMEETSNEAQDSDGFESPTDSNDSLEVQKRLKRQKRQHEREMREMQAKLESLQSQMQSQPLQSQNPLNSQVPPVGIRDEIQQAVSYALQAREAEEQKAKQALHQQHMQKEIREFRNHLDNMEDKYDDFHDVVLGDDAHFTQTMHDYALTLPRKGKGSAGEVLYHLAKNKPELDRIAQLHPMKQAAEMAALSHALISGGETKASQPRPLGQIKSHPVSSSRAVNENTPVSDLRARMKSGSWK